MDLMIKNIILFKLIYSHIFDNPGIKEVPSEVLNLPSLIEL